MISMLTEQTGHDKQNNAKILSQHIESRSANMLGEQNTNKNTKNKYMYTNHGRALSRMQDQIFQCGGKDLDKGQRAVQQILKKKLIVSQYTEAKRNGQNFVNKLLCTKKSPRKNLYKQKLASLNPVRAWQSGHQTNRTIQGSDQLQNSQCDFYFTNYHQAPDQMSNSNKMKRHQQQKGRINNKMGIIRSESAALLNKKEKSNYQKRIKFTVKSYEKPYQSTTKLKIQNDLIPKYQQRLSNDINQSRQRCQVQQNQKWIERTKTNQTKNPMQQKTESKNFEGDFIRKQIGNFKSALDQFRIKKRVNFPNEFGVRLQAQLSNKLKGLTQSNIIGKQKRQSINGWVQQNILKQQCGGLHDCYSSLRLQEEHIAEQQFIQFTQKSKQYQLTINDSFR